VASVAVGNETIGFAVPNGTYAYFVAAGCAQGTPSSGLVVVNGSSQNLSISFSPEVCYAVTFQAHGLPSGEFWSVLAGAPPFFMENLTRGPLGKITFMAPNGAFSFDIIPPSGIGIARVSGPGSPSQGSVTVTGHALTLNVQFGHLENLSFVENGLPFNTMWGVTLTPTVGRGGPPGQQQATTGPFVSFTAPKGASYRFTITKPSTERAAPSKGSITIPARAYSRAVVFRAIVSVVKFTERGLPGGTLWGVNLTGPMDERLSSTARVISFHLVNGSYNFTVWNFTSEHPFPAAGGVLVLAPHPQTVPILFSPLVMPASQPSADTTLASESQWLVAAGEPVGPAKARSGR
jgi:hypothetical protein